MIKIKEFFRRHAMQLLLFAAVILVGAVCFAGCKVQSAEINTELAISEELAGTRQMTITIPEKTFSKYISASWTEISTLIVNNCPQGLSCDISETNAGYTVKFTMEFDSIEAYKAKVEAILGRQVNISVDVPSTVFSNGVVIKEDFSSLELLSWISGKINEAGYITTENAGKLIVSGTNTAVYDGTVYEELDEYISVSDMRELEINDITINTYVTVERTFNREIIIDLPEESMKENGEAIKAYIEGNLLDGVEGVWKERSKNCTFTASVKDKSIEMIQRFTAGLLDDENCVIYYQDSSEGGDILDIVMNFNEELDFSAFSAEGSGNAPVKYNFDIEDLDEISVHTVINDKASNDFTVEDLTTFTTLVDDSVDNLKLQISMNRHYDVNHILASTTVSGNDDIYRDYVFMLSEMPTEFEQEIIDERLRAATEEYAMMATDIIDGKFCFKVSLEGTEAGVSNGFGGAFGKDGALSYDIEETEGAFTYGEHIDFVDFLSIKPDVLLTYTLKVNGAKLDRESFKLTATTVKDLDISGGTIVCNVYGAGLSMSVEGGKAGGINIWLIVTAVIVAVAAIAIGIFIFLKNKKIEGDTSFAEKVQIDIEERNN